MPQLDLFSSQPKPETSEKEAKKDALPLKKNADDASLSEAAAEVTNELDEHPEVDQINPPEPGSSIPQIFILAEEQAHENSVVEVEDVQSADPPIEDAIIFEAINIEEKAEEKTEEKVVQPAIAVKTEAPTSIPLTRKDGKPLQKRGRKSLKDIDANADLIEIPEDEILFKKQYYLISEVAGWFKVNTSLLRFWETEFDVLKPRKNRKGDRMFRPEDVKNLQLIYHLLRERKYTIDGAKEYIKGHKKKADTQFQLTQSLQKFKSFLLELKANLQ